MPYLIGFAGPTASGKSSVCSALAGDMNATKLSMDCFFVDNCEYPVYGGKFTNKDSPEGIRFDEFACAAGDLKEGRPANAPVYDLFKSKRTGVSRINPAGMVMSDGFLLFHDPHIRWLFDLRIYLDVPEDVQRERLATRERRPDWEYFDGVIIPMQKRYCLPCKRYSHMVIDATASLEHVIGESKSAIENFLKGKGML